MQPIHACANDVEHQVGAKDPAKYEMRKTMGFRELARNKTRQILLVFANKSCMKFSPQHASCYALEIDFSSDTVASPDIARSLKEKLNHFHYHLN